MQKRTELRRFAKMGRIPEAEEIYRFLVGKCVNFATAIANKAHEPYHVEISKMTYDNLEDDWVYGVSNREKVDMWKDSAVEWKGEKHRTKITNWYNKL